VTDLRHIFKNIGDSQWADDFNLALSACSLRGSATYELQQISFFLESVHLDDGEHVFTVILSRTYKTLVLARIWHEGHAHLGHNAKVGLREEPA
jgi:hypothetical protein